MNSTLEIEDHYVLSRDDLIQLLNKAAKLGKKRAPRKARERSDEQKLADKIHMAKLAEIRKQKKQNRGGQSYTAPPSTPEALQQ